MAPPRKWNGSSEKDQTHTACFANAQTYWSNKLNVHTEYYTEYDMFLHSFPFLFS